MCGITGLMVFGGRSLDVEALDGMTAALAHRGPDQQGIKGVATGPVGVGFGHTRLRIIDLSEAAAQPMANADRAIWITFDAELVARGVQFRSASDTEVIVRLDEQEGEACLDKLDGMFALAMWGERRQRLRVSWRPPRISQRPCAGA